MLTRVAPSRLPVEEFQRRLYQICGVFQAEPVRGRDMLTGGILLEDRAGFEMAHVAKDLQTVRRTRRDIRKDSGENYFLIVQEEGRAMMSQRECAQMLQPGDMILIDSAVPSEFHFFGSFGRQLSVHLPRTEMQARFGEAISGGICLAATDPTAMAITAVLAKSFSSPGNEEQRSCLREAVFCLVGAMIHDRDAGTAARRFDADLSGARLFERGLAYIDRSFTDGDLTIGQIATDLGVSIRQLQRAFAFVGATPNTYLLQKRLEFACQLLLARKNGRNDVLISSIAYACGFNDISYFNRQFRRAFSCAPREYGEDA